MLQPLSDKEALALPPMSLAFVGDAVQSLYVRTAVTVGSSGKTGVLHKEVTKHVSAVAQAASSDAITPLFDETEADIFRRARNCHIQTSAKHAERGEYRKASGLEGDYRILADFNGTVLAGTHSKYGIQFVTWDWDYDRTGVSHGHYFMEDYDGAKQDFATRSGLIHKEQLFSPEQLTEIFRCCADSVDEDFFELTDTQEEMIRGIQQQIRVCVPDLDERVRQQDEALERASQEQTM